MSAATAQAAVRVMDAAKQRSSFVGDLEVARAQRNGAQPASPAADAATTWAALDLQALLDGNDLEEPPTLLARTDGACLIYEAKLHQVSAEPEAGKGWLVCHAAAAALGQGEAVVYFDFESTARDIASRLVALGVPAEVIVDRFRYVHPDEPLKGPDTQRDLATATALKPALAIIDGVTEALAVHGLDLGDNNDIAKWLELLPRPLVRQGAAVVLVDHVVKNRENQGRYAIGAQHKLAGIDVAYMLEVIDPFARGRDGLVKVTVQKDRPGWVRQKAAGKRIADMRLTSSADGSEVAVELHAPAGPDAFRPTHLMERVSRAIEATPGLTKSGIRSTVQGNHQAKELALQILITEGFVRPEPGGVGKATHHHSERTYREDLNTDPAHPAQTPPDPSPGEVGSDPAPLPPPRKGAGQGAEADGNPSTLPLPETQS